MTTVKRICLYNAANASDETVRSRYLGYFLEGISSVCQKTVCFVSEGVSSAAEKTLHEVSESIVFLPKSIPDEETCHEMLTRVGWEEFEKWDEVVLPEIPDWPEGAVVEEKTSHMDVLPTILELNKVSDETRQSILQVLPGRDLLSLLAEPEKEQKETDK